MSTIDDHLQVGSVAADGSDSESEPAAYAYYQPISADYGSDSDNEDDASDHHLENGILNPNHEVHDTGFSIYNHEANGVAGLDLNGHAGDDGASSEEDAEEKERETEEEEEMRRSLREENSLRSAPLPPESAARVMEAMRGVTFPGVPPDWVNTVADDHWVDRLRSLRGDRSSP